MEKSINENPSNVSKQFYSYIDRKREMKFIICIKSTGLNGEDLISRKRKLEIIIDQS